MSIYEYIEIMKEAGPNRWWTSEEIRDLYIERTGDTKQVKSVERVLNNSRSRSQVVVRRTRVKGKVEKVFKLRPQNIDEGFCLECGDEAMNGRRLCRECAKIRML